MKKKLFLLGALCFGYVSFAQTNAQIQNKKGVDLMPKAGDFAIGFNAVPVLTYIGDLFGSGQPNLALGGNKFVSPFAANTLFGKYMLTDNQAIRAHLRIGVFNNTYSNLVDDNGQDDPVFEVTDELKTSNSIYNIGAGYEWRRGTTRLRGLYGGELFFQHSTGLQSEYKYGNAITEGNNFPTSTVWSDFGDVIDEVPVIERIMDSKGGKYTGIGLRAFAGVEYFFAPKICVGTEFGWGASMGKTSERTTKKQFWNPITTSITEGKNNTAGSSQLRVDTDNFNGSIYLMFYF